MMMKIQVYEGEVTELSPVETENPVGGFTKTVSHVVIGMKTAKGTKQLKLDPSIYEALQKERVEVCYNMNMKDIVSTMFSLLQCFHKCPQLRTWFS